MAFGQVAPQMGGRQRVNQLAGQQMQQAQQQVGNTLQQAQLRPAATQGQTGVPRSMPQAAGAPTPDQLYQMAHVNDAYAQGAKGMTPPTYNGALTQQYGAANPFGMQSWYGGNPLQTAEAAAKRAFGEQLAGINQRYASSGMGNSGRQAVATGQALGDFGTGLGDVLAQRGQEAYGQDANRGLAAFGQAQNFLQNSQQQALQANQQLNNMGQALTAIGASEQQLPMLNAMLQLFGLFGKQSGYGQTSDNTNLVSGPMAW